MSSWCLKCFFFLLIDIIWKLSLFFSNLIFCWESMCCFYLRGYLCVFLGVLALLSSYCLNLFYMFLNSKNLFAIILISNRKQIISYWIKLGYSASDHMCVHIYIYYFLSAVCQDMKPTQMLLLFRALVRLPQTLLHLIGVCRNKQKYYWESVCWNSPLFKMWLNALCKTTKNISWDITLKRIQNGGKNNWDEVKSRVQLLLVVWVSFLCLSSSFDVKMSKLHICH